MHARCAICSDLFDFIQDVAATLCGHIFHSSCLDQWLRQSKSCPQCRLKVTHNKIIQKLYFDTEEDGSNESENKTNNAQLLNQVETYKANLVESYKEKAELIKQIDQFQDTIQIANAEKRSAEDHVLKYKDNIRVYKMRLDSLHGIESENIRMKDELTELRKKVFSLQSVKSIMENATRDVEDLLDKCREKPQVDEVLKWHSVVRRELIKSDDERKKLKHQLELTQKDKKKLEQKLNDYITRTTELEQELKYLEEERENLERRVNQAEVEKTPCQTLCLTPLSNRKTSKSRTDIFSPKPTQRRHSNNSEEWIPLSPEILPDKLTCAKNITKKGNNSTLRGNLKITSKRHFSDSSAPPCVKATNFHFNGLGGYSKYETPFPIPISKRKVPKLSDFDFVTLD